MTTETVGARIDRRAAAYAALPVFRAVRADRVPTARFPAFFREQAVAARFFQDLIWAATEIHTPTLAAFAAAHRKVDSGHWKWSEHDLASTDQRALTIDDCFCLDFLETRIQMARMLATAQIFQLRTDGPNWTSWLGPSRTLRVGALLFAVHFALIARVSTLGITTIVWGAGVVGAMLHSVWWSRDPLTHPYQRMLRQMTVLTGAQLAWALGA